MMVPSCLPTFLIGSVQESVTLFISMDSTWKGVRLDFITFSTQSPLMMAMAQ